MKIKVLIVFVAVLIALGFVFWKEQNQAKLSALAEVSSSTLNTIKPINTKPTPQELQNFEKKLQYEVSLISQIEEDPQETEERLRDFSKSLKSSEIQALYDSSLNIQKPQDERFLAVTLLSWSQKPEAGDLLENIAVHETDSSISTERNADFEAILRMKAVEGLADLPLSSVEHQRYLQNIIRKTSSSPVADRAQRSLWALAGEAESPEKQDEKALTELLEKSTQ